MNQEFGVFLMQVLASVFIGLPVLAVIADKIALPLYFWFNGE